MVCLSRGNSQRLSSFARLGLGCGPSPERGNCCLSCPQVFGPLISRLKEERVMSLAWQVEGLRRGLLPEQACLKAHRLLDHSSPGLRATHHRKDTCTSLSGSFARPGQVEGMRRGPKPWGKDEQQHPLSGEGPHPDAPPTNLTSRVKEERVMSLARQVEGMRRGKFSSSHPLSLCSSLCLSVCLSLSLSPHLQARGRWKECGGASRPNRPARRPSSASGITCNPHPIQLKTLSCNISTVKVAISASTNLYHATEFPAHSTPHPQVSLTPKPSE